VITRTISVLTCSRPITARATKEQLPVRMLATRPAIPSLPSRLRSYIMWLSLLLLHAISLKNTSDARPSHDGALPGRRDALHSGVGDQPGPCVRLAGTMMRRYIPSNVASRPSLLTPWASSETPIVETGRKLSGGVQCRTQSTGARSRRPTDVVLPRHGSRANHALLGKSGTGLPRARPLGSGKLPICIHNAREERLGSPPFFLFDSAPPN